VLVLYGLLESFGGPFFDALKYGFDDESLMKPIRSADVSTTLIAVA
jgi:hypothetical protein